MAIKFPENPCAVCRKNEVEVLCDFVIEYDNHPIFVKKYKHFVALNEKVKHETCDMPMCSDCAKEHNKAHFCPHHAELFKQVKITDETLKLRIFKYKEKNREEFY